MHTINNITMTDKLAFSSTYFSLKWKFCMIFFFKFNNFTHNHQITLGLKDAGVYHLIWPPPILICYRRYHSILHSSHKYMQIMTVVPDYLSSLTFPSHVSPFLPTSARKRHRSECHQRTVHLLSRCWDCTVMQHRSPS